MKKINIGLIGAGNIGLGVVDSILENSGLISSRSGVEIVLKSVCDINKDSLASIPDISGLTKTDDFNSILNDESIDIVIELIGGITPAKDIVLEAIKKGKHIVTANKALISKHGKEIFKAATLNEVFVNIEASVGGGIPIIKTVRESFVSNNLEVIYGILNGTCNFVLTMMAESGCSFNEALSVAQDKGIAESDPDLDISGKDAAHKLAILSLLGFGVDVSPEDIFTEGIESITAQDICYAKAWGYSIKLLAIAKRSGKDLELRVHPCLIPSYHLLANVKGEDNAIFVRGDFVGESLLYGKGAGRRPTASAVVSDVVDIAKEIACSDKKNPVSYDLLYSQDPIDVADTKKLMIPYYLRFSAIDKPGVLSGISTVLAENNISIASMSQEERKEGQSVPVLILTHKACEGSMLKAISRINEMDFVTDKTVVIRIEG